MKYEYCILGTENSNLETGFKKISQDPMPETKIMPDSILVIVEQREGKLNRVSWETLTAGQALAAETGWTLEAAVAGSGVTNFANEIAGKKVAKVYAVESPKLEPYTPDAFAAALKQFIASNNPGWC